MNWDRIEGNWKQLKGKVKEQWGKLTDDDIDVIGGQARISSSASCRNSTACRRTKPSGRSSSSRIATATPWHEDVPRR